MSFDHERLMLIRIENLVQCRRMAKDLLIERIDEVGKSLPGSNTTADVLKKLADVPISTTVLAQLLELLAED